MGLLDRVGATDVAMRSVDVEEVRRDRGLSGAMNTTCDDTTSIEMGSGTSERRLEDQCGAPTKAGADVVYRVSGAGVLMTVPKALSAFRSSKTHTATDTDHKLLSKTTAPSNIRLLR